MPEFRQSDISIWLEVGAVDVVDAINPAEIDAAFRERDSKFPVFEQFVT